MSKNAFHMTASGQNQLEIYKNLRQTMRAKRLALSDIEQAQAAQTVLHQAIELFQHYHPSTVALYLPFNGEISPLAILEFLQNQSIRCCLPVLHPFTPNHLQFFAYSSEQDLHKNRFAILEPKLNVQKIVPLSEIDLIFVPLVACDKQHNRLGMGGGFYDRTLAQMPNAVTVGLAHCCQCIEQLPTQSWDVPLKHILLG